MTDPHAPDRHHDAIEFPDGRSVLVTLLCEGQRVNVLQLPVVQQVTKRAPSIIGIDAVTPVSTL